jgi:hypothetical protein
MVADSEVAMSLNNNRGGLTIVMLVMLSSIFMVMMGIAGVKLLEAAKNLKKHNEAYNYLLVMEELGQAVSRARSLGRNSDCLVNTVNPLLAPTPAMIAVSCPANTVRHVVLTGVPTTSCPNHPVVALQTRNQYTLCVPDRNNNGAADAIEFCARVDNFNYCLSGGANLNQNLERLDLNAENPADLRPGVYAHVLGAAFQQTVNAPLQPRNNSEVWSPDAIWPSNNQIFTTNCGTYAANSTQYWLGCHFANDPRLEFWIMRMCPRSTAIPGVGACPGGVPPAQQRIVIYFENNRPT